MMRVVLDACVLYPTVLRELLLAAARQDLYMPLWSPRILEEWARAAAREGPGAETLARGEITRLGLHWPRASIRPDPALERRLWLPDPDDVHVLAAAITGGADLIVTFNARDFPRGTLAQEGLDRADPDQLFAQLRARAPEAVETAVATVHAEARRLSGEPIALRALLKRAGLPRLGKALDG